MKKQIALIFATLVLVTAIIFGILTAYENFAKEQRETLATTLSQTASTLTQKTYTLLSYSQQLPPNYNPATITQTIETTRKDLAYLETVEQLNEQINTTQTLINDIGDNIQDPNPLLRLQELLSVAENIPPTRDPNAVLNHSQTKELLNDIKNTTLTYEESHEAWQAEQERLAAEQAAAEQAAAEQAAAEQAAAEQAAAEQAAPSESAPSESSNDSGGNGGSSSGSSSGSGGGLDARVKGILSQHGCGSATVVWDSPRLPSGANGAAAPWENAVFFRSSVPTSRVDYVAAHECAHILQYRAYGNDWNAVQSGLNEIYGGTGYSGLEQNADCVTKHWGYAQYHYTQSCSGARGDAAVAISQGRLP